MKGPAYSSQNPPYGRLHLGKEIYDSFLEWEGKGIMCSALTVKTDPKRSTMVVLEIPLTYFEVVP